VNLFLKTWGHEIEPLAPETTARCSGVQTKKGEPRCQERAAYRGKACYVTGPRGRHGQRYMYFCPTCAAKWAKWMEIENPPIKADDFDAMDEGSLEEVLF